MPGTKPTSQKLPIAFWIERRPDGTFALESHPRRLPRDIRPSDDLPVLVNDLAAAHHCPSIPAALQPHLLDVRELLSLTHPTSPADEPPLVLAALNGNGIPATGAKALASAWPHALQAFAAWHPLLAETIVQLLAAGSPAWRALASAIAAVSRVELAPNPAPESLILDLRPPYPRPPKREIPDPATATPLDPEEIAGILGPEGACASAVPGYEHRPGQLDMARAVVEAFNTSRHLVVEAGTGVGKSLAYLVPAILWARRNRLPVVVSTNTKNLQSQLFGKDIPTLRRVLDIPFRAALAKGRMNYVCLRHLNRILERREAELADQEAVPFAKVLAWIAATPTGDLDELDRVCADGGAPAVSLRSRLPCPSDECGGRRCRFASRCLLQRARALALDADVVIANHSLVFADGPDGSIFPKHAQLVFDEAHNLEESATRHFTVEITPLRITLALRRLWRTTKAGGTGALADFRLALQSSPPVSSTLADALFERVNEAVFAADKVRSAADEYFRALADVAPRGFESVRYRAADLSAPAWTAVRPRLDDLSNALESLSSRLSRILGDSADASDAQEDALAPLATLTGPPVWDEAVRTLSSSASGIQELRGDLAFVAAGDDPDSVFWLSVAQTRPDRFGHTTPIGFLQAAPIDISRKLAETVFANRLSIVLCSATLSVNNSFDFLSRRIGLDRLEPGRLLTCRAASPFHYDSQCRIGVPLFLPDPNDESYTRALADFLPRLFRHTRGRALVLFTSYRMMVDAARLVRPALDTLGIPLLVQGSGLSRDRLTRIFRRDVASVLFGTDSFWEGVDVMGESLSCVVVARLPFASLGDPLTGARSDRVEEEGGNAFFEYQVPSAVIRLRQGVGRLIRHRDDRGIVLIADRRIVSKGYGRQFINSLPCAAVAYKSEEDLFADAEPFLRPAAPSSAP